MKVLVISTSPFTRHGITNVIMNLYRNVNRDAIHMDFVSTYPKIDEQYKKEIESNGGRVYNILGRLRHPFRYTNKIAKIMKGYDIIHVHGNSATAVLELLAAKRAVVTRRIVHSHNSTCKYVLVDKVCRPLFYKLITDRLACGELAGKWLYGNRDFTIIQNGIETEKFRFNEATRDKIRKEIHFEDTKVIGHVGQLVDVKNHTFLLDVFAKVTQNHPEYRLLLLGAGMLQESLVQQAKDLHIADKIHFTGSVSNVYDYLSAMDLICMPSKFEGFPLTLVEEQVNGLPCVVADTISKEVNLTGNVEFHSLDESHDAWAEALVENMEEAVSTDRAKRSAESFQKVVECGFEIKDQARKLEQIYFGNNLYR